MTHAWKNQVVLCGHKPGTTILAVNGDKGTIVQTTPLGNQVSEHMLERMAGQMSSMCCSPLLEYACSVLGGRMHYAAFARRAFFRFAVLQPGQEIRKSYESE